MADASGTKVASSGRLQRWVNGSWSVKLAVLCYERVSDRLAQSPIGRGWRVMRRSLLNSQFYRWLTTDLNATSTISSYSYHARAWVFVLLAMMIVGVIAATHLLSPWIGVVALALGVSLFGLRQYWRGNALFSLLVAGYLFRFGLIILNSQLGVLTQPDISIGHHKHAVALVDAWLSGQFGGVLEVGPMRRLVAYAHAPFYVLLGPMQLAGELGTAFYGTVVGYMTYAVARQITTCRNAVFAAGAVVFWPSVIYRSVVIQREIIVTLAMLVTVWVALRLTQPTRLYEQNPEEGIWRTVHWTRRLPMNDVLLLIAATVIIYLTRPENIAIIGVALMTALAIRNKQAPWRLVVIGILLLSVMAYFALNFGDFIGGKAAFTVATLDEYAHARAHGGSAYLTNLHYRSWFDILLYAPVKVVYFLFSPLPWQVEDFTGLLAGVSGWGLFVAALLSGRGFSFLRAHPEKRATLAVYAISGITAYSIIEMNAGAAFRRRIQFVPILLILAVIALSTISFRKHSSASDPETVSLSDSENSITTAED